MTVMIKKIKACFIRLLRDLFGPVVYEKIRALQYLGYWPNLQTPQTLNEKIMRVKLFDVPSAASMLSDKVAVREFVKKIIGAEYLNTLYFSGESLVSLDFSTLPDRFIIKTNNGCEGNIIVTSKDNLNVQDIKDKMNSFLSQKFGYLTNETWYLDIRPQVLIEELMEDENGHIPDDYKLFFFNGVCKMIQVNKDRFSNHNILFYDENWNKLPFGLSHYPYEANVAKPNNFEKMKELAQKLAQDLEFARIDLYSYNNIIKFGEITFAPNAGWKPFNPSRYDKILGEFW